MFLPNSFELRYAILLELFYRNDEFFFECSKRKLQSSKSDSGITIGRSDENISTIPVRISRDPRMHLKRTKKFSQYKNKAKKSRYEENSQDQENEKSFRCVKCEQWFSRKGTLTAHVDAVHMKLKKSNKRILNKFQCIKCVLFLKCSNRTS